MKIFLFLFVLFFSFSFFLLLKTGFHWDYFWLNEPQCVKCQRPNEDLSWEIMYEWELKKIRTSFSLSLLFSSSVHQAFRLSDFDRIRCPHGKHGHSALLKSSRRALVYFPYFFSSSPSCCAWMCGCMVEKPLKCLPCL